MRKNQRCKAMAKAGRCIAWRNRTQSSMQQKVQSQSKRRKAKEGPAQPPAHVLAVLLWRLLTSFWHLKAPVRDLGGSELSEQISISSFWWCYVTPIKGNIKHKLAWLATSLQKWAEGRQNGTMPISGQNIGVKTSLIFINTDNTKRCQHIR